MTHLKFLRKRTGLTLEILSELTGISVSYLSRLESGSRRLNTDLIRRLSGAFNCDPAELLVDKIHEESALLPAEIRLRRSEMFGQRHDGSANRASEVFCDLPVYVLQQGSQEGRVELKMDTAIEMRHRPAELAGKREAFALKAGTHFRPYYSDSSLLWLNPSPQVAPEATVLIVTEAGEALLKKIWSVTPTSLQVCSIEHFEALKGGKSEPDSKIVSLSKEDALIELDRSALHAVYRVVGSIDLSAF
ncbi:MAG: helix-turn-helix domain-containing protein [Holosporales bacterium]|nr:helix-turn-helix domain-containing protein [Holosporales bacterium]